MQYWFYAKIAFLPSDPLSKFPFPLAAEVELFNHVISREQRPAIRSVVLL